MTHLRKIDSLHVFDDTTGTIRPIHFDADALAQRGLVHVHGTVYDCCRHRHHTLDGIMHSGDLRIGRKTFSRHSRAGLPEPKARFAGEEAGR